MKRFLLALLFVLCCSGVPAAVSADVGDPIPNHLRISNSPYVITTDGAALFDVRTGTRTPLSQSIYLHSSYQKRGVMSVDGQHVVLTVGCGTCSTTRYVIDLDGQVTSAPAPSTMHRLVGADVAQDRLVWATGSDVMVTTVQGDVVWERKNLGTAAALSTDGKTVIAATHDLTEIAHLDVATGVTETVESFDVKVPVRYHEAHAFDGVIAYPDQGFVYLEASRRLVALPETYQIEYAEQDGKLHWHAKGVYGVVDVASGELTTYRPIVSPKLYPGVLAFSDRTIPLASYKRMPTALELSIDRAANAKDDPYLYVGRSYPLAFQVTNLDGIVETIPFDQLKPGKRSTVTSPLVFPYVTDMQYDLTYLGKQLTGTLSSTTVGKLSLYKYGLAGEVVGQTAPRARITVRVHPEGATPLEYSTTATATGEFRVATARLAPGTPFTVSSIASGSVVYRQAFTVPTSTSQQNDIEVVSDSAEAGVVFKTVPNGSIDVYVKERFHSWFATLQADATGVVRLTGMVDPLQKGVVVTYAPAGSEGIDRTLVVYERAEPSFRFEKTPSGGDVTLSYASTAKGITYQTYLNDQLIGETRAVSLPRALKHDDLIRVVATTGDRTKTLEHRVVAVGPTLLQVTDVAMTATHTVISVRRDTRATLQFFVNGTLTPATPVSTTRFTIPAKPGDIVLVRLVRDGQKLDTRLALPLVTFSNIRLHDEQTTWVGVVLPNSNVTLQNGTTLVSSGKSSSTGRVVLPLAPQALRSKVTLVSTRGVYRFVQTVNVQAGLTPVLTVPAPTRTARTLTVNSNVEYGTVTVRRGTTRLATQAVTSKTTTVAIAAQPAGTRLTVTLTTPKGRTQTVTVTVR